MRKGKTDFYTTHEVAELLPNYNQARTLLEALHNNRKKEEGKRDSFLSELWNSRRKVGKRFLFNKQRIDNMLSTLI